MVTVRQSCLQWMWGRWPVLKVCVWGVYCTKTTAILVLFTTRPGYLLPGKTWADLQWQKPCWSPADPRTKLTWCEAMLSVTLLLPVDDKPGRGELPPSCYHPTAPFLRLEPQPFHTWSSHPSTYSQTQEQVSSLISLACKFFGERAAPGSVCPAFSIIKSCSLLQRQVLLNASSFIASPSSFPTPQSCAAGKTSYFPWQLLYFYSQHS